MTITLKKHRESRKPGETEVTLTFVVDNEDTNRFNDWLNQKLKEGKMSIEFVPTEVENALEDLVDEVVDKATSLPGTIDDVALSKVIERSVRDRLAMFGVRGCYA